MSLAGVSPRALRWARLASAHSGPTGAPRGAFALLSTWRRRLRYRRELKRLLALGAHLVEDVGLMPVHARREAAKPFWRA